VNQARELAVQIRQLEEQLAVAQAVSVKDQAQIARLIDALEESAAALDMELQAQQETDTVTNTATKIFSTEVQQDGFIVSTAEHEKLTAALEASATALREAQDALKRSSEEVAELRNMITIIQTELQNAIAAGGDTAELLERLSVLQFQLAEMQSKCNELEAKLANAFAELEQARNTANLGGDDDLICALRQEVEALAAERDAATAREQICQTELDHLRQRRSASAGTAYADLLATNESLEQQIEALEEALRAAGAAGEQGDLIEALVREIALLKAKYEKAHSSRVASLERRLDKLTRHRQNSTQQVTVNGAVSQTSGGNGGSALKSQKRIFHRRFFLPAGEPLENPAPARTNVMVRVDATPAAKRLGIADSQGWIRIGSDAIELIHASSEGETNELVCSWPTSSIRSVRLTAQCKVSFSSRTSDGKETISLTCKHPQLAHKLHQDMHIFVPKTKKA
jgi:DNA repair exonuclease SbcCD ATPase subunit